MIEFLRKIFLQPRKQLEKMDTKKDAAQSCGNGVGEHPSLSLERSVMKNGEAEVVLDAGPKKCRVAVEGVIVAILMVAVWILLLLPIVFYHLPVNLDFVRPCM